MQCLNCGNGYFILDVEDWPKPFIGSMDQFKAPDELDLSIIAFCTCCHDSFIKFKGESLRTAYDYYAQYMLSKQKNPDC